jgi:hypothetical protein
LSNDAIHKFQALALNLAGMFRINVNWPIIRPFSFSVNARRKQRNFSELNPGAVTLALPGYGLGKNRWLMLLISRLSIPPRSFSFTIAVANDARNIWEQGGQRAARSVDRTIATSCLPGSCVDDLCAQKSAVTPPAVPDSMMPCVCRAG